MCAHLCTRTCLYYAWTYTCLNIYIFTNKQINKYIYIYIYMYIFIFIFMFILIFIFIFIPIFIYVTLNS